ncbi:MAG: pseudouridine synthase, partial [Ginsengibacter sp.]
QKLFAILPMHRYFILNKPRNMVSQFVSPHNVGLLGDLDFKFPPGTHALGRLDKDSEGLLLLTTDKRATRLLFSTDIPHLRTYLVMVQNKMTPATFTQLQNGIGIKIKNAAHYIAKPAALEQITGPMMFYGYATDARDAYPHTWLLITLTEGKYRQVRKMVLAARHRCLRLIRLSVSGIHLGNLKPGEVKEIEGESFYRLLDIQA